MKTHHELMVWNVVIECNGAYAFERKAIKLRGLI